MKYTKTLLSGLFALLMIPFLIACGGSSTTTGTQTGTLALNLKDAPIDLNGVYVTIKEISVHVSGDEVEDSTDETNDVDETQDETQDTIEDDNGWKVVAEPNKTYNLLELQDGVTAFLGEEELPVGHYTQMRLVLGDFDVYADANITKLNPEGYNNFIVDENNATFELIVPSGYQSGIKLIKGFDIIADQETNLTIDFDALKSVVHETTQDLYKMKPTITIIQE